MKTHFIRGSMVSLVVFILMMTWVATGLFMNHELPESPIAFSIQKHWLFSWTIVSLMLSFVVMVIAALVSALIGTISKKQRD